MGSDQSQHFFHFSESDSDFECDSDYDSLFDLDDKIETKTFQNQTFTNINILDPVDETLTCNQTENLNQIAEITQITQKKKSKKKTQNKKRKSKKQTNLPKFEIQRSQKREICLPPIALELRSRYYSTFTHLKKFQKKYILEIHRKILAPQLGLRKMTRDEMRQKDNYFLHFSCVKDQILVCLENNKDVIFKTILKDIKKKKQ